MKNFEKNLEDATEDELKLWVNQHDFRVVPLAPDELTRRSLLKLQEAIEENTERTADFSQATKEFNTETSKQTEKLISLTWVIVFLTIVMIGGIAYQIYLAKIRVSPILSEQERNERRAFESCSSNPDSEWPSSTGGSIPCKAVLKMLEGKFE